VKHLLPASELHVWQADLLQAAGGCDHWYAMLSPQERQRAARFLSAEHRRRFIAAHGILRDVLSRYTHVAPAALSFNANAHGKPALPQEVGVAFNLSHSGDRLLIGISAGAATGVDIEQVRERANLMKIAQRFFSANECAALQALPEEQRLAAFYRCWTRKEAYIKAKGKGLGIPLAAFEVSLGSTPVLLRTLNEADDTAGWTLWNIEAGADYTAAAMVAGSSGLTLRCFHYSSAPAHHAATEPSS
jgi:4'-phosphopantetheinyl transferase